MIKILFNKHLLTCDYPTGCQKYLHLKNAQDADRAIKEDRWLALQVGERIIFLCGPCQGKAAHMTKEEWARMREAAHTVTTR